MLLQLLQDSRSRENLLRQFTFLAILASWPFLDLLLEKMDKCEIILLKYEKMIDSILQKNWPAKKLERRMKK
jgi:hypothetical protein